MVVDPRAQLEAEIQERSAPVRAALAASTDPKERRRLKAELRKIRREVGRLGRVAKW